MDPSGFTVIVDRPGATGLELTPIADSIHFTTTAVGGYGDCSFSVPGLQTKLLPYLATLRLMWGPRVIWEGRIEDRKIRIAQGEQTTAVSGFGLQRLLSDNSVRRIWSKRDIPWATLPEGAGADVSGGSGLLKRPQLEVAIGRIDVTDQTLVGVQVSGVGNVTIAGCANGATFPAPSGLSISRLLGTVTLAGPNTGVGKIVGYVWYSANGVGAWTLQPYTSTQAFSLPMTAGQLRVGAFDSSGGGLTPTYADTVRFTDMRVLGTTLLEDATGGFYGSTILRDLIALCPGLIEGVIEQGSDFTIDAIERSVRSAVLDAVKEVVGYYAREWAVWDGGRFDWTTPNLEEASWVANLAEFNELEIAGSVDTQTKTSYVLYTDAANGSQAEASAASTSQRNPYVRLGVGKDDLNDVGFPMTSNTSAQFAARIAALRGAYPPSSGRVVLPADKLVKNIFAGPAPAVLIRAGTNLLIPDLPKDDVLTTGRDGQTLFHIVATEVDMEANTVTLEIEGQAREIDVITARLSAVTRTLTG